MISVCVPGPPFIKCRRSFRRMFGVDGLEHQLNSRNMKHWIACSLSLFVLVITGCDTVNHAQLQVVAPKSERGVVASIPASERDVVKQVITEIAVRWRFEDRTSISLRGEPGYRNRGRFGRTNEVAPIWIECEVVRGDPTAVRLPRARFPANYLDYCARSARSIEPAAHFGPMQLISRVNWQ